jgi:hypothetical protein
MVHFTNLKHFVGTKSDIELFFKLFSSSSSLNIFLVGFAVDLGVFPTALLFLSDDLA